MRRIQPTHYLLLSFFPKFARRREPGGRVAGDARTCGGFVEAASFAVRAFCLATAAIFRGSSSFAAGRTLVAPRGSCHGFGLANSSGGRFRDPGGRFLCASDLRPVADSALRTPLRLSSPALLRRRPRLSSPALRPVADSARRLPPQLRRRVIHGLERVALWLWACVLLLFCVSTCAGFAPPSFFRSPMTLNVQAHRVPSLPKPSLLSHLCIGCPVPSPARAALSHLCRSCFVHFHFLPFL